MGQFSYMDGAPLYLPPSLLPEDRSKPLSAQPRGSSTLTRGNQDVEVDPMGAIEGCCAIKHAERLLQGHGGEGGVVGDEGHTGQLGLEVHTWWMQ